MNDVAQPRRRSGLKVADAAGLLVAGAIVGGIFAGSLSASAASDSSAAPSATSSSTTEPAERHGAKSVRSDETVVTGTNYETLKACGWAAPTQPVRLRRARCGG